jgi:hypothetical protein
VSCQSGQKHGDYEKRFTFHVCVSIIVYPNIVIYTLPQRYEGIPVF